jgi:predicted ester cyclase
MAPTGKRVVCTGIAMFHFARGKIVDGWVSGDTLSLLLQLGAISTPAQAAGDPS